jgi:putative ABC transport system permease protein
MLLFVEELFRHVMAALLRNKLRSALTMAGIAWGVASIVLIVAMGDGFKEGQRDRFKQIGENIVILFPGKTEKQAGGLRAGRRIRLNYDDLRDIQTECYMVRNIIAELQNQAHATTKFNGGTFSVLGVEPMYSKIRAIPVDRGRFLAEGDNDGAARVAVLGDNVRKVLFGDHVVVPGDTLLLNGLPFRIVGLMPPKSQNSSYNGMDSEKIYIPYSTMVRDMPLDDANFHPGIVSDLIYVPADLKTWKDARSQVVRVLARNHRFDPADESAVRWWDTVENAQLVDNIFTSMTAFLGVIALVTLTLGGVGVMNIMLVSVTERTREIGLRKALGATRNRILADFLLEGVILAGVSGLVGWLGAYGIAAAVNSFPKQEMFAGLPVSGQTTAMAFGALAVIAVASAMWPAWRASRLTPVEALNYER